jgi:hypothetical protein
MLDLFVSDYLRKVRSPEVLPNWILMGVGVVGAVIGVITLIYLYRQSKDTKQALDWAKESAIAAKTSADAALANAQAIINAERAWITANAEWRPDEAMHIVARENRSSMNIRFRFQNQGRTPAWITSKGFGCMIRDSVPDEPELDSDSFNVTEGLEVINAGGTFLEDQMLMDYANASTAKFVIVYGLVKYRDIFNQRHATLFGYRIFPGYHDKIEPFLKYNSNL